MEKKYSNGELTIIWKPDLCSHSGECVKALPQVYDPKSRPWIRANNASTDELISQIRRCPTQALSFRMSKTEVREK